MKTVEVVATAKGFLGKLREVGEKFDAPEGLKSSWFVPVETAKPVPAGKAKADKDASDSLV